MIAHNIRIINNRKETETEIIKTETVKPDDATTVAARYDLWHRQYRYIITQYFSRLVGSWIILCLFSWCIMWFNKGVYCFDIKRFVNYVIRMERAGKEQKLTVHKTVWYYKLWAESIFGSNLRFPIVLAQTCLSPCFEKTKLLGEVICVENFFWFLRKKLINSVNVSQLT